MIYVDDSGWGSLIGGVAIGIYDSDMKKMLARIIPVKYFQGSLFIKGIYRKRAIVEFLRMYSEVSDSEHFYVCRGTILDGIYRMLISNNYDTERIEIGDPLQGFLEERFAKHLKRFGVPQKSKGAHCLSFNEQLEWVREDPSREKHVKTGWKSWQTKYKT